jgi:hypothetical protein
MSDIVITKRLIEEQAPAIVSILMVYHAKCGKRPILPSEMKAKFVCGSIAALAVFQKTSKPIGSARIIIEPDVFAMPYHSFQDIICLFGDDIARATRVVTVAGLIFLCDLITNGAIIYRSLLQYIVTSMQQTTVPHCVEDLDVWHQTYKALANLYGHMLSYWDFLLQSAFVSKADISSIIIERACVTVARSINDAYANVPRSVTQDDSDAESEVGYLMSDSSAVLIPESVHGQEI